MNVVNYRPEPGEFAWTFGGVKPVRTRPGDGLELWTRIASPARSAPPDDLVSRVIDFPSSTPRRGLSTWREPSLGDTLAIPFHLDRAGTRLGRLDHSSFVRSVDLYRALANVAGCHAWDRVDLRGRQDQANGDDAWSSRRLLRRLPPDPMHGTVGVAPAAMEARSCLVPEAHGGNMDTPEM